MSSLVSPSSSLTLLPLVHLHDSSESDHVKIFITTLFKTLLWFHFTQSKTQSLTMAGVLPALMLISFLNSPTTSFPFANTAWTLFYTSSYQIPSSPRAVTLALLYALPPISHMVCSFTFLRCLTKCHFVRFLPTILF